MRKADFIQHVLIRSLPPLEKVGDGVAYAESLWTELSRLGYGAAKQAAPTENINHYKALSDNQRQWFDSFWKAFDYKHDRNGAAMRFGQLGELDESEYKTIVAAAKKEAKRTLPSGQSRKMAQGWLADMRYNDYHSNNPKHTNSNNKPRMETQQQLSVLQGELNGVKRLYSFKPTPALKLQITQLEQQIDAFNQSRL